MNTFRVKRLHRDAKRHSRTLFVIGGLVALLAGLFYAEYIMPSRLTADPTSYRALLDLIAKAESNGNYTAHFGDPGSKDPDFTTMTLSEVQAWQRGFVASGQPSSAVGRYQIISTTLDGLIIELKLSSESVLFNESTQDRMAVALLERRGLTAYVNDELTREEFAANLAKEWAGLPRIVGQNPEESFYSGDDLNAAQVSSREVLEAIDQIVPDLRN